jgi:hypothetical protein
MDRATTAAANELNAVIGSLNNTGGRPAAANKGPAALNIALRRRTVKLLQRQAATILSLQEQLFEKEFGK